MTGRVMNLMGGPQARKLSTSAVNGKLLFISFRA